MAESRVYIAHATTGAALVKRGSGNCPCDVEPLNDVLGSNDGMWKVECYGMDSEDRPNLVYIRNDWHPQRALNASGDLVDCSMRASRDDELWHVIYPDTTSAKRMIAFQNKASRKYLAVCSEGGSYKIAFQTDPCYWFVSIAKHALSPGQVVGIAAAVAAVVASGGTAGAAVAGAVGWGTAVIAVAGAAAETLKTISDAIAKIAADPTKKEWVVDKM